MRTVTLLQLRTDVINQADLVEVGADTFITTTELNRWIVQSSRRFLGRFVRGGANRRLESQHSFSTVAGTAQYALPSDFFELYQAQATRDGEPVPIYPASPEMLTYGESDTIPVWVPPKYRIIGSFFELTPVPDDIYTVAFRYCPNTIAFNSGGTPQTDLSADTDYLDGINGWEQWIVWDACVKAALKQDQDAAGFKIMRDELGSELDREKRRRNRGPRQVRQVYMDHAYRGRGPWGWWP